MTEFTKRDLHTPFNEKTLTRLWGVMHRARNEQTVAASLATSPMSGANPAPSPPVGGTVLSAFFVSRVAAAAGESMTVDVLKNGVSILTGVLTFDATKAAGEQVPLSLVPGATVKTGDALVVTRVYVAGGGPTMAQNGAFVEWGPSK